MGLHIERPRWSKRPRLQPDFASTDENLQERSRDEMTRRVLDRIAVLLLCVGVSCVWAAAIRSSAGGGITARDFGEVYYSARCVLHHVDPYDPQAALREFKAAGGKFPTSSPREEEAARITIAVENNLPTAVLVLAPLAMLSWPIAQAIWIGSIAGLLVVAAFLIWSLATDSPGISGWMAAFIVLNCMGVLVVGNLAGVVVPLCAIAAWCFVKRRYELAGVVMLALGLVMKPHDSGFVWLYFLLAGGSGRKRAVQTLGLAAVLGVCAAIWIAPASPHWMQELDANVGGGLAPGGFNDPGPTGQTNRTLGSVISLQNAASVFSDNPRFYNPVSYLIGGGLILAWAIAVLRKRSTPEAASLALATISLLSLLPVYHRPYDAKLLLLTIPACAMLWAGGRAKRWIALGLTSAAIFVTSDIPLIIWTVATSKVGASPSTLGGKLTMLVLQPAPLVLLAAGCFYLWVYIRFESSAEGIAERGDAVNGTVAAAVS